MSKTAMKKKSSKKNKRAGYTVRALIRGGAAEKAGISPGDVITKINGRSTAARYSLGKILSGYKRGAKVSVTVAKLDGRTVFIRDVVLGGKKGGRGTLGIISGKKNAGNYNVKRETSNKKVAKVAKKLVEKSLDFDKDENPFMSRAKAETADVMALMADMKGRDALMAARNLKRKLKTELREGMVKSGTLVDDYLKSLHSNTKSDADELDKLINKTKKRSLSRFGKITFTVLGASSLATASYFIYGLITSII